MLELRGLRRLHVGPVDLRVEAGECVSVMGDSGAGKSVLLRMVADLDPHDGEAALDGRAAATMPAPQWRRQVAYVAADAGWWAPRVGDHFADHDGTPLASAGWLPRLGVAADALDWPVARLSTGERQRLALLRALRPAMRVLLLDEPTSGLDADNVARVEALLATVLAGGAAIVMVTHDAAQARRLAARRLRLADGVLAEAAG